MGKVPRSMILRIIRSSLLLTSAVLIASCGHRTPSYNPDFGPFDEDGNYVEAWADNPPKKRRKSKPAPAPAPEPAPAIAFKPAPPLVASTPKPTYKPKPAPKPKPKPKPKPRYKIHKVVKGDTLYGLGRKYGVSVSSIQKANGISGSIIRIGQSLKIPVK